MKDNKYIITKGDIAASDLVNNGRLSPEQSGQFIWDMVVNANLMKQIRFELMRGPVKEINKMGFDGRILRAGSVDLKDSTNRSKGVPRKLELVSKKYHGEVRIPYDVIEDGIDGGSVNFGGPNSMAKPVTGGFKDNIVEQIAAKVGVELLETALLSDTLSGDPMLALTDGWIKRADQHDVDQLTANIDENMFAKGIKELPEQYHATLPMMLNLVSYVQEINYRQTIAAREDNRGSQVLEGFSGVFGHGVPVQKVPFMPVATGLLTHPQNLIMGIQREVSIETAKDIETQEYIIVVSLRCDFQIQEPDAIVRYLNIGS